jgi:ERCC4-type nuclease
MENNNADNRRKHVRVPVRFFPLVNISPNENPKIIFQGTIIQISEGGVLIEYSSLELADYILPLKKQHISLIDKDQLKKYKVWMIFELPPIMTKIKALGQIIRADGDNRLALEFMDIAYIERKRIKDFVSSSM